MKKTIELLNYKNQKKIHLKDTNGFCGAGYYEDTLCGKRIIYAKGNMGFGIVWELQEDNKIKPVCGICKKLIGKK